MKKNKSAECGCSMLFPKNLMIGKECYLSILQEYPPKTRRQYRKYEKAVVLRLGLNSPLTVDQGNSLVIKIGIDNLGLLQEVIDGKVVSLKPVNTFYQRLIDKLGE